MSRQICLCLFLSFFSVCSFAEQQTVCSEHLSAQSAEYDYRQELEKSTPVVLDQLNWLLENKEEYERIPDHQPKATLIGVWGGFKPFSVKKWSTRYYHKMSGLYRLVFEAGSRGNVEYSGAELIDRNGQTLAQATHTDNSGGQVQGMPPLLNALAQVIAVGRIQEVVTVRTVHFHPSGMSFSAQDYGTALQAKKFLEDIGLAHINLQDSVIREPFMGAEGTPRVDHFLLPSSLSYRRGGYSTRNSSLDPTKLYIWLGTRALTYVRLAGDMIEFRNLMHTVEQNY